jgi:hypothetical protein
VRAPPTCRWPVGLGAKRTRTPSLIGAGRSPLRPSRDARGGRPPDVSSFAHSTPRAKNGRAPGIAGERWGRAAVGAMSGPAGSGSSRSTPASPGATSVRQFARHVAAPASCASSRRTPAAPGGAGPSAVCAPCRGPASCASSRRTPAAPGGDERLGVWGPCRGPHVN